MSNLLQIVRLQPSKVGKKEKPKTPLIMEYPVHADTAPYLVTSSTGTLWVEEPHPGGVVKAAVRQVAPGILSAEILAAVIKRGLQDQWGSVHFFTEKGLRAAIAHVESYDLTDLVVLVQRESAAAYPKWLKATLAELDILPKTAVWVPPGSAVVIPRDRTLVGAMVHVDAKSVTAVVHNAARGIGIAWTPE